MAVSVSLKSKSHLWQSVNSLKLRWACYALAISSWSQNSIGWLGQCNTLVRSLSGSTAAGASLVILDMGGTAVDTSNPTGKLILNVMSSVAQFEREMMLERQREGIAKAKAEGKYKGRKPTARAKADMVKLALDKGISKAQICRDLDISKTSLYRIIGELKG